MKKENPFKKIALPPQDVPEKLKTRVMDDIARIKLFEDLANLFLYVLKNNLEGVYNGVAPNPVSNQELTKTIATVLNKPLISPNPTGGAITATSRL